MVVRRLNTLIKFAVVNGIVLLAFSFSLFAQGNNPVILIPGLAGSELLHKDTGNTIWVKIFRSKSEDLRLPISADLARNRDKLVPGDVVRRVRLGIIPVVDAYGGFLDAMSERGGYREEKWEMPTPNGYRDSIYVFAYDWRLDIVENARLLIRRIEALKLKLNKPDLKFDVVGHSMGGLIARYAAMYGDADLPAAKNKPRPDWQGARHFDRIVLLGTPNEGSAMSLNILVNGVTLAGRVIDVPLVHDASKFTAFTLPSAFQLLPAPGTLKVYNDNLERVDIDIYDPKVWSKYGWNPIDDEDFVTQFTAAERSEASAYFAAVLDRSKRLHQALAAVTPAGISFNVLGSDCRTALDSIVVIRNTENEWKTLFRPKGFTGADGKKITTSEVKKIMYAVGDGIVTRRSLEAFGANAATFECAEHTRLAANTRIQNHIIGLFNGKGLPLTDDLAKKRMAVSSSTKTGEQ